jgi:lipid-binding SYLF domain-containing protein
LGSTWVLHRPIESTPFIGILPSVANDSVIREAVALIIQRKFPNPIVPKPETLMKNPRFVIIAAVILALAYILPTNLPAESKVEKQEDIQKVEQQTLRQLYQAQPLAKAAIEKAAGYAVFSDMGIKILFGGTGNGQGVVVNNQTNQKTYMKMVELQAGLGFGISKFRNVFVFKTKAAMDSFINSGWQFGGQATAGAKTADSGGAMQGAVSVDNDIWMYQLTEKGLNVSVTVTGAKYYKDDSLN